MTGKLKTLVLAVLAVAAIAGVTASAASAAELHIKDMGKVTGDGTQLEGAPTEFKVPEGGLQCPQAKFNVHTAFKLNGEGKQEDVETTASRLTVKVEEKETPLEPETLHCKFGGTSGAIVHMNGCDLDLRVDELTARVTCPAEKQITVTAIVLGVLKCTIHISEQGDLGGLKVTDNEIHQDVKVTFEVKGIKYTSTTGQGLGACKETQAGTDGELKGTVTVQGTAGSEASDIWYESAPSGKELHIKDMGKVTGDGVQIENVGFNIPEGELKCPQAKGNLHTAFQLNGKGEQEDVETTASTFTVKAEENETPLEPETLHCTFAGLKALVHMSGCEFTIDIHALTAGVTCLKEHQITITFRLFEVPKCTVHIPEQDELKTFQVSNDETKQDVRLTFQVKEIKYTTTKGEGLKACTETQAGTNGQFKGTVTVQGTVEGGVESNIWYE